MSILDDVLAEEYERLTRMKTRMQEEYLSLPKGYLSRKVIRGYECYYFQHREGNKVVGSYVREEDVPKYVELIDRRRSLKKSINDINKQLKKLERAIK